MASGYDYTIKEMVFHDLNYLFYILQKNDFQMSQNWYHAPS